MGTILSVYPAPSNLLVISKKHLRRKTELYGVLEDLKSQNLNILVSLLGEEDRSVCLPTSMFAVDQSTSVPNKRMKLAHGSNIGIFWYDLDMIYHNVRSALENQGHRGQVSIWAYCEKNDLLLFICITMIPTRNRTARLICKKLQVASFNYVIEYLGCQSKLGRSQAKRIQIMT